MTTQALKHIAFVLLCVSTLLSCKKNEVLHSTSSYPLIPKPHSVLPGSGSFQFTDNTKIALSEDNEDMQFLAKYLSDLFKESAGFSLDVIPFEGGKGDHVFLHLDENFEGKNEAYQLLINAENIEIRGNHHSGLFYGIQTLRQLLPNAIESKQVQEGVQWEVPAVSISDEPRFEYRGMHMDVSRHFFDLDELKTFVDRLAFFKLNRFHIHLTDDQGWRLEIHQYPELTEKGAWRKINSQDEVCLERAQTDPSFQLPEKHFKDVNGEAYYGGFYTQEQMKELVHYAAQRGITIVPEIDMPGHMKAAIDNYPELSCVDGAGWGQTFSIPLCPCEEGVYDFVEKVLSEVVEIFPGEYIHIGADEVEKTTWENAPSCIALMKKEGFREVEELQSYFVKRIEKFLHTKGKKMIGWDEVLEGGINPSTTVMYWRGWVPEAPIEAIEGGHDVIMSPTSHCYFDYPPNNESLLHVYNFDPIPQGVSYEEDKIIGLQANLWSEYIPTLERLDYMFMPRMLSIAEVAWTQGEKDTDDFLARVEGIYDRLDRIGIHFRLPDIPNLPRTEVFVESDTLKLDKPESIDEIRYTTDGSTPDLASALYIDPILVSEPITFTIASFRKQRRVNVYTAEFRKESYLKAVDLASKPGLQVYFYEGDFGTVKDIKKSTLIKSIISDSIYLPDFVPEERFGLIYEGFIELPETGVYSFYLRSDDGSTLEIGDQLVINNDGDHGAIEKMGQIARELESHFG